MTAGRTVDSLDREDVLDVRAVSGDGPERRRRVALVTLTLIGLAIRCHGIGGLGLWYDEVALWEYALTGEVSTFSEPPMMPHLLYLVMWWFGSADPLLVHLLPAVLGSLTIPLAFHAAARLGESEAAGLAAALLTAVSPMAIHYSREGRPYALFILLSAGVYLAFARAFERDTQAAWLAYGALLLASSLSHLLTVEVIMVLGLFSAVALVAPDPAGGLRARGERFGRFLFFTLVGGACGGFWAIERVGLARAFDGLAAGGLLPFLRDALVNLGPGPVRPYLGQLPAPLPELLALAFLALFAAGLYALHRRGRRDVALLLFLAVAVPLLVKYVTLGRKASWDWARWTTHALLPYLATVAIGMDWLGRRLRKPRLAGLLPSALVLGMLPASIQPFHRPEYERYRTIAAHIEERSASLQGILVLPVEWRRPGAADYRITDIHQLNRRESLPTYHFAEGRIEETELVPSRGGLTSLRRASGRPVRSLPPGAYAVLSRRPLEDCAELARWIRGMAATSRGSHPVVNGLTVCDFDFHSEG